MLVAPTGCGKTWTAIMPFIYSLLKGETIAERLIYVLPLRSLASALYQSIGETLQNAGIELDIRLQTGEQRDDPFFQGDIVFTTIDQALSGLLTIPVSLPPRLGNIVAGSFIGSYVVFDEIHLMETGRSLATTAVLTQRLGAVTRFIYMSATIPKLALKELCVVLNATDMVLEEDDFKDIPTQHGKKRFFRKVEKPLSPEVVLGKHSKRSLVICNTVRRAQEISRSLNNLIVERGLKTQVLLLHSRYLPDDRKEIENRLTPLFGSPSKSVKEVDAILVSTQVVEAGLDISCENLHTEIAPANSIIQRAGRCARYSGEEGTVWIYLLDAQEGREFTSTAPYEKALVKNTWDVLDNPQYKGNIDFNLEKGLLEIIHGQKDLDTLRELDWISRRQLIRTAWKTVDYSLIRKLLRDVDSVSVLIHDEPEDLDLRQKPEFLSIPRSTILGWWNQLREEKRNSVVKVLFIADKEDRESEWQWRTVNSMIDIKSAPFLVALNPAFATYDPMYGLVLGYGGDYRSGCLGCLKESNLYSYRRELFSEHITKVLQALQSQKGKKIARKKLSQLLNLKPEMIKRLERLTAIFHDTGKLTVPWQKAVANWQEARNGTVENALLAHTDFNPYNCWDKEHCYDSIFLKPPHAIEGAIAVSKLVMALCVIWTGSEVGKIATRSVLSAISCHHSSSVRKLKKPYMFHPRASSIMVKIMRQCGIPVKKWSPVPCPEQTDLNDFSNILESAVSGEGMLLYWHLARSLRLADQKSFEVV